MIVAPNAKMVTIDDLKALEAASDEKAFYKVIQDSWSLSNATDGLYINNIDYTTDGMSEEDLAAFLGIDISAYSDDDEGREALQNDLSDAYQMRDYEFGADAMLDYAISSFIDWAEEEEQDDSGLQSLKTRLAENSALAFDKTFRTSLAEELQKLLK